MKKYILFLISESVGPWFLWSSSSLRMKLTNERSDRGLDDQSGAREDGGPWQPRRVTVSQSPCTGSSLWQTTGQDRWDRANCSCHLPKEGKFMVVSCFCGEDFMLDNVIFQIFSTNEYFILLLSFVRRLSDTTIFFSMMRPGARRHSIAVGFSSSSGSGIGNWHKQV